MGIVGLLARLGVVVVAFIAVLIGSLLADLPGKFGLWNFIDTYPLAKGATPLFHGGPWGFNHSTLSTTALQGRTFVVTGANIGLGYGTVHYLALHGGRVVLGCRSQKNCDEAVRNIKKEAPNAELIPLVLDLSSFKSIKQFAEGVHQKTQVLHSLILNAGLGAGPLELTQDGLEMIIGVNHFGHAYLVDLLLDLLKKTTTKELPANIVVVSSALHMSSYPEGVRLSIPALNDVSTYDPDMSYGQSKLANVLYAQELAERLKPSNILVNSVHPGLVATNILAPRVEKFVASYPGITHFLNTTGLLKQIKNLHAKTCWDIYDGSLSQVYLAVSPEVLSKGVTGKYFHPVARLTPADPIHGANTTLQKKFWAFTQEVVNAKAK